MPRQNKIHYPNSKSSIYNHWGTYTLCGRLNRALSDNMEEVTCKSCVRVRDINNSKKSPLEIRMEKENSANKYWIEIKYKRTKKGYGISL